MMEYKDYYHALGISKSAGADEIKSAYRRLARKYHPDLHPDDKKAEAQFKEINEAYEVLGDADKRKKYDELGANWEEILRNKESARHYASPGFEWGGAESFDVNDFFETFFGGLGGGGGRRRPGAPFGQAGRGARRGDDATYRVEITLEEAFHGTTRRLQLSMEQPCAQCHGSGVVAAATRARGGNNRRHRVTMGSEVAACPSCHGRGTRPEKKSLDVKIPRGVTQGSRVRLSSMGGSGVGGGPSGDLYLEIHLTPHQRFHVKHHDLLAELPVRDDEAALGTSVDVPTLEGSVSLKVPPGSQQGSRLRLKEKGLPHLRGTGRGDLYYTLKIVTPADLSPEERKLILELKRLRDARGDDASRRRVFGG